MNGCGWDSGGQPESAVQRTAAAQVRISHLQTGHGGVWRLPCSPRLLAGCSLSSATLSWSDDDVYR